MAKDTKLDQLARVRLFSACSKKELTTIGRASDEVTVADGAVLCKEGDPGHEFYLVLKGGVNVSRKGKKLNALGPGQHFGELALLHRGPRNATIVANGETTLLVLGQREFSGVLDSIPGLAHKLLSQMAARLGEADMGSN